PGPNPAEKPATPQPPRSPFAGVNVFTAWDPRSALKLKGLVDGVALTSDNGWATPEIAAELRSAGFRVFAWEARAGLGQSAVAMLGAEAYIAQSEKADEQLAAAQIGDTISVPKALVGRFWLPGWTSLLETYGVA